VCGQGIYRVNPTKNIVKVYGEALDPSDNCCTRVVYGKSGTPEQPEQPEQPEIGRQ